MASKLASSAQSNLVQQIQRKLHQTANTNVVKSNQTTDGADTHLDDICNDVKPVTISRVLEDGEGEDQETTLQKVVVYQDRAEITRLIKVKIDKGNNGFIVKNISKDFDDNSIRVQLGGPAVIRDVIVNKNSISLDDDEESEKMQKLKEEIKKEKEQLSRLEHAKAGISQKLKMMDSLSKTFSVCSSGENVALFTDDNKQSVERFFDMLDLHVPKLDEQEIENTKEIEEQKENIEKLTSALDKLKRTKKRELKNYRQVILIIEGNEACELAIQLQYVVTSAKWTPMYDVRVSSTKKTMQVTYHGLVQQSTGEAWEDVNIALSTASPNIGAVIPNLGTQTVGSKRYQMVRRPKAKKGVGLFSFGMSSGSYEEEAAYMDSFNNEPVEHTNINESLTSTMFEIIRPCTIYPDNDQHKVTVAIVDFNPTFLYETIPCKSSYAFLKAVVKNTSEYVFLPGDTNVFLDNSFVAKGSLKSVHPQEEFTCSLGVDPAVSIKYPPIVKYKEHYGYIYKTNLIKYKQIIKVTNTHSYSIDISICDQLPRSTEDKIKVTLKDPNIKIDKQEKPDKPVKQEEPVRLNSNHNIEWDLTIPSGETKQVLLQYTVEYPSGSEIEFSSNNINNGEQNFSHTQFNQC